MSTDSIRAGCDIFREVVKWELKPVDCLGLLDEEKSFLYGTAQPWGGTSPRTSEEVGSSDSLQ